MIALAIAHSPATQSANPWLDPQFPSHWPNQQDLLHFCQHMGPAEAAVLTVGGVIYVLWGLQIYRTLMIVNACLVGAFLGAVVGSKAGATAAGALAGAFLLGAVAWPTMKYSVAILGGLVGAIAGASIWNTCQQPPDLAWAGALSGLIFCGLMSFILMNATIVVFLSLQGATMFVAGAMGLAFKYADISSRVGSLMEKQKYVLPAVMGILVIIGMIFQHSSTAAAAAAGAKKK